MGWIILAVFLTIAAFVGISFIPQNKNFTAPVDGYFDNRDGEFVPGLNRPTTGRNWDNIEKGQVKPYTTKGFGIRKLSFVALLLMTISVFGFITRVHAVEVGIVDNPLAGGLQEATLGQGYKLKNPLSTIYKLSLAQQRQEYLVIKDDEGEFIGDGNSFSVQTKNGEFAMYSVVVVYQIRDGYQAYSTFKGMPTSAEMAFYVQKAIKGTAGAWTIYEVLGEDMEVSRVAAEDALRLAMMEFGIHVVALNFEDLYGGEEIEDAINRQGISAKEEQISENLLAAARIDAQKAEAAAAGIANAAIEAARGAAESEILRATAEAEKILLEARAEAEAIELIATADAEALRLIAIAEGFRLDDLGMTPEQFTDYIKWSLWDGELPEFLSGDASNFLFGLDPVVEEEVVEVTP